MSDKARDTLRKSLLGGLPDPLDKDLSIEANPSNMNQLESKTIKTDSNKFKYKRISINISLENYEFINKYSDMHGVPTASKCSELLNNAINQMRKESN